MAVRPSTAGSPAIELNGLLAGLARSLQMPGYLVEQVVVPSGPGKAARLAANVSISAMAARIDLGEPGPLLEWALSLPRGNPLATDGAALVLDADRKVQRRVEWSDGLITELKLPVLDANSKLGFSLDLAWQPSSVRYAKPSGARLVVPVTQRKAVLLCNFRVQGLPFDASFITQVALPTVTAKLATEQTGQQRLTSRHYSVIDLGELRLEFAARSRDEALAWVQKLVADGRIADSEYLTLQVELLDASLKAVLATVTLAGCGLLRFDEDPIGTNAESVPRFSLRFSVGQLDLRLAKG